MLNWYSIENKADNAEVLIYNVIGGEGGITAATFAKELQAIDTNQITLRMNTPGGSVFDGIAIYNALKAHPAKVTCMIDGVAASIGSVIAMAADEIQIAKNAHMMIHNAGGTVSGESNDMRQAAEMMDRMSLSIAQTYSERTGQTVETIQQWMNAETWMNADEAIANGFADKIADTVKLTNVFDLSKYPKAPNLNAGIKQEINNMATLEELAASVEALTQAVTSLRTDVDALMETETEPTPEPAPSDPAPADAPMVDAKAASVNDLRALFPGKEDNGFVIDMLEKNATVAQASVEYVAYARKQIEELKNKLPKEVTGQAAIGFTAQAPNQQPTESEPKALAEWEWENKKPEGFTTKERYVAIRVAEINGQFRNLKK